MCSDPKAKIYPQRSICYATMEQQAAVARYDELHSEDTGRVFHDGSFKSWAKDRSASHPYRYNEGVTIYVADRDLNPDDAFLSPGGVSPGEDDPEAEQPDDRG